MLQSIKQLIFYKKFLGLRPNLILRYLNYIGTCITYVFLGSAKLAVRAVKIRKIFRLRRSYGNLELKIPKITCNRGAALRRQVSVARKNGSRTVGRRTVGRGRVGRCGEGR